MIVVGWEISGLTCCYCCAISSYSRHLGNTILFFHPGPSPVVFLSGLLFLSRKPKHFFVWEGGFHVIIFHLFSLFLFDTDDDDGRPTQRLALSASHCPNTFFGSSSSSSSRCAQELRRYIPSLPASPCCTEEEVEVEGGRRRPLGLGRGASFSSSSSCCNLPESPEEIPPLLVVHKGPSCTLFLLLLLWRSGG